MFGRRIRLFELFGFTVHLDLSWLLLFGLVTWTLAAGIFPGWFDGYDVWVYWSMGALGALGLFFSIVWHELSHSLVARAYGLPMNGITLFLFGGVAEMNDEPPSAKAEFLMAIAGPASSLVLAGLLFLGTVVVALLGASPPLQGVFGWLSGINVILAIFNMVPAFPLDGGRVLRAALWHWKGSFRRATRTASTMGSAFGFFLMAMGFLNLVMMNPIGGLWWILIGMFVRSAAQRSYQQVVVRQMLEGEPVRRFMNREPVTVHPETSLQELVDDYVYRYHHKMYPVLEEDELHGCVHLAQVKQIEHGKWSGTPVGAVAQPCSAENTISPDDDATEALARMRKRGSGRLMVVDNGHLVGMLTLKDLLKFLSLKLELDGEEDVQADELAIQQAAARERHTHSQNKAA